ncbi:pentatricopeptide repeat-containing protein At3g05340-like [Arachis stenosperma]|uniref:pentatricopeptide repeat-containing protein At3g05340-like n=1 Tax=Arachis stenosperma TaxID=217475 RepID=UPI0025ABAE77|nr:pentatricopeptide repeat-containing protein At3g05340-like [Arachis stenosperma]
MKSRWKFNVYIPSLVDSLSSPVNLKNPPLPTSQNPFPAPTSASLLSLCGRDGNLRLGSSIHAHLIKRSQSFDFDRFPRNALFVWNSLLSVYSKCGELQDALKVFDRMPVRDTVSWNTMISGFLRNRDFDSGLMFFKKQRSESGTGCCGFDKATLTTVLSACDGAEFSSLTKMIHGLVFLGGFEKEIMVGNALITSYFKCGCFSEWRQVFDEMLERNVVTWTAVISGLAQNEFYEDSLNLFAQMRCGAVSPNILTYLSSLMACSGLQALREGCKIHGLLWKLGMQSDLCIESALMDFYSKCGSLEEAWKIFESAEELDEISLTVILVAFAQNGFEEEAIQIFMRMLKLGIEVDPNMVSAILGVFGIDTSLSLGKQIHSLVIKKNFIQNPFVSNGLVNMYSKCGDLNDSLQVFHRMSQKNSVSWNSIIAAFARHGDGFRALEFYEEMRMEGVAPTDVTFLSLLHACSHAGFVDKGMEFLESMTRDHGISPRSEHYACVVDMLGRAGLLEEAKKFIEGFPENPGVLIWQALLGACSIHGDSEMGKYAADQLFLATPERPAPYVLMANIYSIEGKWKERAGAIKRMKEMGVAKEVGISCIEIDKKVNSFVVGDKLHPKADIIYWVLCGLLEHLKDEGYVPDKKCILYYLGQENKDYYINIGLLNISEKTNLRIMGSWLLSGLTLTATPTSITILPLRKHIPKKQARRVSYSCSCRSREDVPLSTASAYAVLGLQPDCSTTEIKAAFRSKVKQFHPDVNKDGDSMIRRVIEAYQILSNCTRSEIIERECLDPFDAPECEAFDIFVNELLCVGKACSSSCVQRAPHAFSFVSSTGTARASSQGHGDDYQVQCAVGQCPRNCIHYVTPSQRILLEELLDSILEAPYDISAEADLLYSLITKAKFENNRFQKPKKQPKTSSQHVEWF